MLCCGTKFLCVMQDPVGSREQCCSDFTTAVVPFQLASVITGLISQVCLLGSLLVTTWTEPSLHAFFKVDSNASKKLDTLS